MYRSSSFLLSVIFHLSIVVLMVFWPASTPKVSAPLTGAMVQGLVTIGKAGGPSKIRPQNTQKDKAPGKTVKQPDPKAADVKEPAKQGKVEAEVPDTPQQQVKPVQKTQEPAPKEKKQPEKPVENPDAVKIAEKRDKKIKETKTEEKQKTDPKAKKTETTQASKETKQKQTKPQKGGSAADKALAELGKTSKDSGKTSGKESGSSAADALKEFQSTDGDGDGSGTASGSGYGEGGYGDSLLIGSYTDSLVSRIRPNWSWTGMAERRALEATFLIKVAADGTIESHKLIQSSGSSSFDASVTKAIVLTQQVEPPPSSIPNGEIMIIFRPDDMR